MDNYGRDSLLVKVAKLYYEFDYNQGMIAKKFEISRSYVSKLLAEAKERGIVTIHVHDPSRTESQLERDVRQKYELRRVIVVPSKVGENAHTHIAIENGKYLNSILKAGDIIGTGSGQTLNLSSRHLIPRDDLPNITVVSMEGQVTSLKTSPYLQETVMGYAGALGGTAFSMPLPMFLSDAKCKELMFMEPAIQQVYELQKRANIVIFTVAPTGPGKSMSIVRQGLFSEEQMQGFIQEGAIANIFFHFLNFKGEICNPELEARNTALGLKYIRQKEYRICLAAGRSKIDCVTAALNGGFINVLITDEDIAEGILR